MIAILAGFRDGAAYARLVATNLLEGLLETWDDDSGASVAVHALGVGYTVHQMFEPYTLFNWSSSTVLPVLVFGVLAFGAAERTIQSPSPT